MKNLIIPKDYRNMLTRESTESAIKFIKDEFEKVLSQKLDLQRVTAPMLVLSGTGINDDLNGVEQPVRFPVGSLNSSGVEVVQSLAKWKRMKLARLDNEKIRGIYTDMNALRPDEDLDNLHSVYVDQWDWEKVLDSSRRNLEVLKQEVRKIYRAIVETEVALTERIPVLRPGLPQEITFVHSEELQAKYPGKTPKEREDLITREYGAVFVIGIGHTLKDGAPHDHRAPDYDDWSSPTINGYKGLNGDILVWNPVLEKAFEISSMGIRVSPASLERQLHLCGQEKRKELPFHARLLEGGMPQTMGGGIGQSRLCMLYLQKAHIGEVQAGIWPDEMRDACEKHNIELL